MSANVWLYFLIPEIITDAENEIDNIDEISLFDEGNQHVLELQEVPAFRDFWYQKGITKFGDHEF